MALPDTPAGRHAAVRGLRPPVAQTPTGAHRHPSTGGPRATSSATWSGGSPASSPAGGVELPAGPSVTTTRRGMAAPRRRRAGGARHRGAETVHPPPRRHRPVATRSTGSTPPTCSCTPGTWPGPPARTPRSTRTSRPAARRHAPDREMLRDSGQYGPAVPVPDDAPDADRLLGFIGRDPRGAPATEAPREHRGDEQRRLARRVHRRPARRSGPPVRVVLQRGPGPVRTGHGRPVARGAPGVADVVRLRPTRVGLHRLHGDRPSPVRHHQRVGGASPDGRPRGRGVAPTQAGGLAPRRRRTTSSTT